MQNKLNGLEKKIINLMNEFNKTTDPGYKKTFGIKLKKEYYAYFSIVRNADYLTAPNYERISTFISEYVCAYLNGDGTEK